MYPPGVHHFQYTSISARRHTNTRAKAETAHEREPRSEAKVYGLSLRISSMYTVSEDDRIARLKRDISELTGERTLLAGAAPESREYTSRTSKLQAVFSAISGIAK
jgi:hypothetical protein